MLRMVEPHAGALLPSRYCDRPIPILF